ncbi:MAG: hypothetical protein NT121_25820 [Chloroflexi bacterium]|nr:hypothetical protein [Chloroflexota bacterium]
MNKYLIVFLLFLTACAAPAFTPPAAETGTAAAPLLTVYASAAAQPWLSEVYSCAEKQSVVMRLSETESSADLRLRIGEPENLTLPVYQIDSEELLIVTHRESPIQNLTADEARGLFSRPEGQAVQIWVFASGEDVQQVFAREIMHGSPVTSLARVALSPQQMSDTLNQEKNALGILPRHWKAGSVREVFSLPDVPVLALTTAEPQGALKELLACLQK